MISGRNKIILRRVLLASRYASSHEDNGEAIIEIIQPPTSQTTR